MKYRAKYFAQMLKYRWIVDQRITGGGDVGWGGGDYKCTTWKRETNLYTDRFLALADDISVNSLPEFV